MDQNNLSAWDTSPTSNSQWTSAVVTYHSDTPHSVTCVVASCPYQKHPTVDVKEIEADKCAGIGL
eukprot:11035225-Ditylum_brightwellii.AAC.1